MTTPQCQEHLELARTQLLTCVEKEKATKSSCLQVQLETHGE